MRKILLLSGGMDSMLILKEKGKDFFSNIVYIDYGHRFKEKEFNCCKQYITDVIKIENLKEKDGFYFGRNLRFFIAIREKFEGNIAVYFGNNSDDNYADNSFEYFMRIEKILNDSYPFTIRINTPFFMLSKEEIYNKIKELDIAYYFCDLGGEKPCLECHSCIAMIEAKIL